MKHRALLFGWLALLPAGGIYHLTAGPNHLQEDSAAGRLDAAREAVAAEQWKLASSDYSLALEDLPEDRQAERIRIRLEAARSLMQSEGLVEAHTEFKTLLDEILDDPTLAGTELEDEARAGLADSQFYMTWLLKLEGMAEEFWRPEIESARQNYRLLAERSAAEDSVSAESFRRNLEASIRLARLDITALQGMPIPKQCSGCCSNCNKQGKGKRKSGRKGQKPPKDNRGATAGPPPEGQGS